MPPRWTEPGPHPSQARLRGTGGPSPRCEALAGPIGAARCTIYEQRPGICRTFQPSWHDGAANPHCDEARQRHGLAPLAPDWPTRPATD